MAAHNQTGNQGEDAAAFYLQDKGYRVRDRNWRAGKKELDIVAEKDGEVVFVEVKTRQDDSYGEPWEFVTRRQWAHIAHAASSYLCHKEIDQPIRFDILSIIYTGDVFRIEHIENAFTPTLRTL